MKITLKLVLFLFLLLYFMACTETSLKYEHKYYLINKTEKKVVHQISSDKEFTGSLDTLSFYSNGTSDKPVLEWNVTAIFNSQRNAVIFVYKTNLYNISDTTSLGWSSLTGPNGIYTRFGKNINNTSFRDDDYSTFTGDYYLTIDNDLLSLMKKDYGMLEKFKEHYQK